MADKNILVDSGATDNFIHPKLLKRLDLGAQLLDRPGKIWNIDGTTNRAGQLTSFVDLEVRMGSVTTTHIYFIFLLLFITCTITVSHMTDASSLSHMTHNESSLGLYSRTTHCDSPTTHPSTPLTQY
jgi:hypothetical protein